MLLTLRRGFRDSLEHYRSECALQPHTLVIVRPGDFDLQVFLSDFGPVFLPILEVHREIFPTASQLFVLCQIAQRYYDMGCMTLYRVIVRRDFSV